MVKRTKNQQVKKPTSFSHDKLKAPDKPPSAAYRDSPVLQVQLPAPSSYTFYDKSGLEDPLPPFWCHFTFI